MKRIPALLLALVMILALAACGQTAATQPAADVPAPATAAAEPAPAATEPAKAEPKDVIVFAAASMTETLTEIKAMYEKDHPEINLIYNFDSSGTLKTQIQEGADCDLFISAGQKQMNQLDINASAEVNTDGLDFVVADSRMNLLENKVTLVVPEGNPKGIESFDQLADLL